jgi:hypothetical protein
MNRMRDSNRDRGGCDSNGSDRIVRSEKQGRKIDGRRGRSVGDVNLMRFISGRKRRKK